MKILKLTFKNINNLKGHHEINFDALPLSSAGIFAITGPTGSGKSTILDVITLALFNKIPRFKNTANKEVIISKKQIQEHGSIMTLHTGESYAAIKYEINGTSYTSEWTLSKARTGNLKDYEMYIYDTNGRPLDLKKSEVPAQNEELIGLSYGQFVKSIILSQGEFSKFLKADKNERGKLLENITGTSIYRKIGIAAFQKEKSAREAIEKAREIIGVIEVLPEEEVKELTSLSERSKKEKEKFDVSLKQLIEVQKTKEGITKGSKMLRIKQEMALDLKEKEKLLHPYLEQLQIHEKLSPVQGKIAIYNDAIANKRITNENLSSYKSSYETSNTKLEKVIAEMTALTKTKVDQSNFKKVMSSFEKEINDYDRDLQELKSRGTEERNRVNQKIKSYPDAISTVPTEAIEQLKRKEKELSDVLAQSQLTVKTDIGGLKEKLRQQRENVLTLQGIYRENDVLTAVKTKINEVTQQQGKHNIAAKELAPKLISEKEMGQLIKDKVQLLHKQKSDAERIERLEDIREKIEDGKPCPLCGSLDHPYSAHKPSTTTSDIDKKIKSAEEELTSKSNAILELEKQVAETNTAIKLTTEQLKSLKTQQAELSENIENKITQYQGNAKIDIDNLHEVVKQAKIKETNFEKGISAIEEHKANTELQELYTSLSSLMESYKSKHSLRQEKYQGVDITAQCNQLQDQFEASKTSIERLKVSIEKESKDLKRAEDLVIGINKELTPQIAALGFSNLEQVSSHILSQEEVEKIRSNKEELAKLLTSNQTEISTLQKDIKALSAKDNKVDQTLEQINVAVAELEKERDQLIEKIGEIGTKLKRDQEDRKRISEKEKEIKELTTAYDKWAMMKKLIGDANGNNFANFAQGLTLQNLLVFANRRLKNLSDRYLLDKTSQEDTLNVIDQYQGNIRRAVSTLSGGESFLISLALALSLSDMASKTVSLDSLFIDEGFGTLDQETLEIAINTLEKLQSESQKTVGVISHVAALKERINVQIVLNKNPQGYSEIEIIS